MLDRHINSRQLRLTRTRSTQLKLQHRPVSGSAGPALAEELWAEDDFWERAIHFSLWGGLWYTAHALVGDPHLCAYEQQLIGLSVLLPKI